MGVVHSLQLNKLKKSCAACVGAFLVIIASVIGVRPSFAEASGEVSQLKDRIGYLFYYKDASVWLGPELPTPDGEVQFCIQLLYEPPRETYDITTDTVSVTDVPQSLKHIPELALEQAEAAWLLGHYSASTDADTLAAIALIMHANFETDQPKMPYSRLKPTDYDYSGESLAKWVWTAANKKVPDVVSRAKELVQQARNERVKGYVSDSVQGEGRRHGSYTGFAVQNSAGHLIDGVPVTVTLNGPAVWDETGSNIVTAVTSSQGMLTKKWSATGNGDVTISFAYRDPAGTATRLNREETQDTLTWKASENDVTGQGKKWHVVYDFQPVGVSHIQKISDSGVFTDVLYADADSDYGDGRWLSKQETIGAGEGSVPVVYTARAYQTGSLELPARSDTVPEDAVLIGSQKVSVEGPGEIQASFTAREPGWYTVVWSVDMKDQAHEWSEFIHGDWADGYGVADETSSYRYETQIDSSLSMRETKAGTYLVDDVWVSGLPADHPDFRGGSGFKADVQTITHKVLFFPNGLEVTEENKAQAEQIGEAVTIRAENGFYPSVGDTSWLVKIDEATGKAVPGTYVFVSEFAGDDRVKPLVTSVEDKTEQYVVEAVSAKLHTTASDTSDGDKILEPKNPSSITDRVCDVNKTLTPSTVYEIVTRLYLDNGSPLLDKEGKPVSATSQFTPKSADECAVVTIEFDGSQLAGKKVVVFEDVLRDGQTIATHHDLKDTEQTVTFAEAVSHLSATGAVVPAMLCGAGALIAGGSGALRFKRKQG